ncbi:TetR/AcrR family transcriptional regulator [Fodinicola acaciae]|uniref:TetR/AcrR family transcriptional regulator n=1 Tax=Fodinicola acaciae TaxID=2681555 RepID=UPI0013D0BEE3|nr:TetR/AcrR family transcriptional regulator [Fodinicola acaciae]
MEKEQGRRRAPAMSVEDRRAAIVKAALPLVMEHGANVTTKQVAQVAGIAEGTVFRAFADKDELIRVCVVEAFRMDEAVDRIRQTGADVPLDDRLRTAATILYEQMSRIGVLMQALAASGYDMRKQYDSKDDQDGPHKFFVNVTEAVGDLIAYDQDRLTIPASHAAQLFLSLIFGIRTRYGATTTTDAENAAYFDEITRILLHGAIRSDLEENRD